VEVKKHFVEQPGTETIDFFGHFVNFLGIFGQAVAVILQK
jgi:hypothetical protein